MVLSGSLKSSYSSLLFVPRSPGMVMIMYKNIEKAKGSENQTIGSRSAISGFAMLREDNIKGLFKEFLSTKK